MSTLPDLKNLLQKSIYSKSGVREHNYILMEPQHARFVPILANDICQGEVTLAIKSVIYT